MNILMVSGEFPPISGGVGYYVYNLAKNLKDRGHEVVVLTRGGVKTREEIVDGIKVFRVQFLPLYPFHLQPHQRALNKILRKIINNIDIVHLHSPLIPKVNIRKKIPIVVTEHGTAKGFIEGLELKDLFSLTEKMFSWMYTDIDKNVIKMADKITAVSRTTIREIRHYYKIYQDNIEVVGNGVDTSVFSPRHKNDETLDFEYILYTGTLITKKGSPDLIESARLVVKEFPEVKFVLTGKGPLERYLRELIKKYGLSNNVVLLGYVDRDYLVKLYKNATIYVLPSYHEGLPTTVLEAMACEISVITTPVGGTPEVIENGKNGILVPPKTPTELAHAIVLLLDNPMIRKKLGKRARKTIEERFSWRKISEKFEKIYDALIP